MGTIVTMEVVDPDRSGQGYREHGRDERDGDGRNAAMARAFQWFETIEACCTRFDPRSELMQVCQQPPGTAVVVSEMLYHLVQFALAVAAETDGAFDPTIGRRMETIGFNRNHRTGLIFRSDDGLGAPVTHGDVHIDDEARTITLQRPLTLDLGAVAKGFAIDMAARELAAFTNFAIDAGGDVFMAGRNANDLPWSIGIRHPRIPDQLMGTIPVSERAVCTSGDYERRSSGTNGPHHILSPRSGASARECASVTVVASSAMLADALSTAAFVLGPEPGIELLKRHDAEGLIVSASMNRYSTAGMDLGRR